MDQELFEDLKNSIKEAGAIQRGEVVLSRKFTLECKELLKRSEAERSPGHVEETLESAGCTGGCPTYPGAPKTEDGMPDCTKCPQFTD